MTAIGGAKVLTAGMAVTGSKHERSGGQGPGGRLVSAYLSTLFFGNSSTSGQPMHRASQIRFINAEIN